MARSAASRLLPMPASPVITARPTWPAAARSQQSSRTFRSAARPRHWDRCAHHQHGRQVERRCGPDLGAMPPVRVGSKRPASATATTRGSRRFAPIPRTGWRSPRWSTAPRPPRRCHVRAWSRRVRPTDRPGSHPSPLDGMPEPGPTRTNASSSRSRPRRRTGPSERVCVSSGRWSATRCATGALTTTSPPSAMPRRRAARFTVVPT